MGKSKKKSPKQFPNCLEDGGDVVDIINAIQESSLSEYMEVMEEWDDLFSEEWLKTLWELACSKPGMAAWLDNEEEVMGEYPGFDPVILWIPVSHTKNKTVDFEVTSTDRDGTVDVVDFKTGFFHDWHNASIRILESEYIVRIGSDTDMNPLNPRFACTVMARNAQDALAKATKHLPSEYNMISIRVELA